MQLLIQEDSGFEKKNSANFYLPSKNEPASKKAKHYVYYGGDFDDVSLDTSNLMSSL